MTSQTLITLFILSLATYRLTHLVVFDKIVEPIRNLFVKRKFMIVQESMHPVLTFYLQGGIFRRAIGMIVICHWCTGLWVSFILTIAYYQTFNMSIFLQFLAAAAIASLIETAWAKLVGYPELKNGEE